MNILANLIVEEQVENMYGHLFHEGVVIENKKSSQQEIKGGLTQEVQISNHDLEPLFSIVYVFNEETRHIKTLDPEKVNMGTNPMDIIEHVTEIYERKYED